MDKFRVGDVIECIDYPTMLATNHKHMQIREVNVLAYILVVPGKSDRSYRLGKPHQQHYKLSERSIIDRVLKKYS